MKTVIQAEAIHCYHCGEDCREEEREADGHHFCCAGCLAVYQLLAEKELCDYYQYSGQPGKTVKAAIAADKFSYLDEEGIRSQLLDYTDEHISKLHFFVPSMHCSSCIWLLENLQRLDPGIVSSRVDFPRRQVFITYRHAETRLSAIVHSLAAVGYEPSIRLADGNKQLQQEQNKSLLLKIGVAGFALGNIMLFSAPEYLGFDTYSRQQFAQVFIRLNLLLSLPVFFYSASVYFISAWKALRHRHINIDVPLALGISTLFMRSLWDVYSGSGPGFFDSMAGLVFFLLMGKWMQERSYEALSFDRDYTSYFPLAVSVIRDGKEQAVALNQLKIGEQVCLRNNNIVPADAILRSAEAWIDYSFVSGESEPLLKKRGDTIFAGGIMKGPAAELSLMKAVSQSYLTQLWNNEVFRKKASRLDTFSALVARYFTWFTLLIAAGTLAYWLPVNTHTALEAFTAVLIVACPCVLVIAAPFALGNALRAMGRHKFYLKSTAVVEQLAAVDTAVFDKTGTITEQSHKKISFTGEDISSEEFSMLAAVLAQSSHPLSRRISAQLPPVKKYTMERYEELAGKGILALVQGQELKIGSAVFTGYTTKLQKGTAVYISINGKYKGVFSLEEPFRSALNETLDAMPVRKRYLFSGDHESQRSALLPYFSNDEIYLEQSPQDKLDSIKKLQDQGHQVLMLGDGLNDAGALKQADLGVSVTDDISQFTPASDAILDASSFHLLPRFIQLARGTMKLVRLSFIFSLIYNLTWMYFAVQGQLSPLLAALLMPVSSITVFSINALGTRLLAKRMKFI